MFLKICPKQIPNKYRKSPQLCPIQQKGETRPLISSSQFVVQALKELLLRAWIASLPPPSSAEVGYLSSDLQQHGAAGSPHARQCIPLLQRALSTAVLQMSSAHGGISLRHQRVPPSSVAQEVHQWQWDELGKRKDWTLCPQSVLSLFFFFFCCAVEVAGIFLAVLYTSQWISIYLGSCFRMADLIFLADCSSA